MQLVPEQELNKASNGKAGFFQTYKSLFIIVGLILLPSLVLSVDDISPVGINTSELMTNFMAGFFLVFSGLKLLDIPGFAKGYSTYDLLARRVRVYGYIYPFLELFLGLSYLTRFAPFQTNVATVILMVFSGIGVLQSILQKRQFQCACLGTFIKVPLTKVTLVEDFGMAAMAGILLLEQYL